MNAWKKLLLICLACAALSTPGALPSTTFNTAGQCQAGQGHVQARYYYIYVRACAHDPWVCYGYTNNAAQAAYCVNYLRYYGYEAFCR